MEHSHSIHRKLLLTWLVLPLIFIWFSTNYLLGVFRPPTWGTVNGTSTRVNSNVIQPLKPEPVPTIPPVQWNGEGIVTLWFDDGWMSQYITAYPLLSQYGYKGALAVPTKLIGYDAYMSWAQVRRMQTTGWEITSHTRSHDCKLFKAGTKALENELGGAAADLKAMNLQYENFVSPCGVNSADMKKVAEKYYLSFRTSEPGYNAIPVTEPYNLLVQTMRNTVTLKTVKGWIQQAKREHKWLIIMFHQVNEESEYSVTSTMLRDILQELKDQKMNVVLPSQALQIHINSNVPSASTSATVAPIKKQVPDIGL